MANVWYDELQSKFKAGIAHAYVLHGNCKDYVDIGSNFVPLNQALAHFLKGRQAVVFYNRSSGWRFRSETEQKLVQEMPIQPAQAMGKFEKLLKSKLNVAVVIEYAESVFASGKWDGAGANAELGTLVVTMLRWAKDDVIHDSANPIILLCADSFESLHPSLRSPESKVEPIFIPYPNRDDRLKFISWYLKKKEDKGEKINMNGVSRDQLANMTSALSLLMIEDILLRSDQEGSLDASFVRDRKDEIIRAEYGDLVEVPEPRHGWEAFSSDYVIKFFNEELIVPLKAGDKRRCPMAVMMSGPPGTGKSIIAEAVAKECGVNYMKLNPGRLMGGVVGKTEENTERILRAIKSIAPCIVFIDEFDKGVPREDAYQGDSGVASRFLQRLQDFAADTHHRGEIVFLAATNRPDRISAALKRAGRFGDIKIPILPPADNAARVALFKTLFAKYEVKFTGKQLQKAAEKTDNYVGADIEAIVVKACKLSKTDTIGDAELLEAVACMRPSVSAKDIEFQTALALNECNDLSMIPERYRKQSEQVAQVLEEHKDRIGGREL